MNDEENITNITIINDADFKSYLEKDYNQYLVTIIYNGSLKNKKYFAVYKPIIITVSQELLDHFIPSSDSDGTDSTHSTSNIIIIISIIGIISFMLIIVIVIFC